MRLEKDTNREGARTQPRRAGLSIRSRAPAASSRRVHEIMRGLTGVETRPEKVLRSRLHRLGLRFWKERRPLPDRRITADVVFPRQRVCVFVDGCFWHGCPTHFRTPASNASWWSEKILDNRSRDTRQTKLLRRQGWLVLRYWEHDVIGGRLTMICQEIAAAVEGRRAAREETGG